MKINIFNKIIIMVAVILLVGCAVHQPVSAPTAAASADTVTFSGKIITDGGRSAGVDIDINKLDLSVTANNETETKSGEVGNNKTTWSITLPKDNTKWIIEVKAELNNTLIYDGTTDVIADGTLSGDCNIIVYFKHNLLNSLTTGSISLTFVDAADRYSISKVYMKDEYDDAQLDRPVIRIDASADFNTATHTATLNAAMYAGQETKIFEFCDADGNTLYQCQEVITVLAGCTTDTWFGASSHIKKNDDTDKFEFKITDDLIERYGPEIVPRTEIVLYDNTYDNGDNVFQYTFKNKKSNSTVGEVHFCFDNTGDLYVLKGFASDDTLGDCSIIEIIKQDNGQSIEKRIPKIFDTFTIDRNKNIFYGFHNEDEEEIRLYSVPLNNISDTLTEYRILCDDLIPNCFVVYNDELFISGCIDDLIVFVHVSLLDYVDMDDSGSSYKGISVYDDNVKYIDSTSTGIEASSSSQITDMIYQDGAVYILLNDNKSYFGGISDNNLYSRGAVIKYDLWTKEFTDTIGWAKNDEDEEDVIENDTENLQMYLYDLNGYEVYSDENAQDYFLLDGDSALNANDCCNSIFPTMYAPNSEKDQLSETAFYGPQKFIAIRPKKLIIADDGLAFYIEDNGALLFKNVNRIVTVDLESFSIDDVTGNYSVSFQSDIKDSIKSSFNLTEASQDDDFYNKENNNYFVKTLDGVDVAASIFIGIKNAD